MKEIRIEVTNISFEDFQIIKELMEEWDWKDTIRYDLIHSSDDEDPIITFYIPEDSLGAFFGAMFFMGAESIYRKH